LPAIGQHPAARPWLLVFVGQGEHTPAALAPVYGENVLVAQGVHGTCSPVAPEYVPGEQKVQAVCPAMDA